MLTRSATVPDEAKPAAAMQRRSYAIALDRQIVIVLHSYRLVGAVPDKLAFRIRA